jgi:hypothetical protein
MILWAMPTAVNLGAGLRSQPVEPERIERTGELRER